MPERLTESLVRRGKIDPAQAKEAHRRQLLLGGALDSALFELKLVDEAGLLDALSGAYGLATLSARQAATPTEERALRAFPEQWARKHLLAPLTLSPDGATLTVISPAPADVNLLNRLGELLELSVRPVLAPEFRVHQRLCQLYGIEAPDRFRSLIKRFAQTPSEPILPPPAPPVSTAIALPPSLMAAPPTSSTIDERPLSFGEAVARLREADDRDEIIRIALLYAAKDLAFVGMFINHEQTLEGRQAMGPGAERFGGLAIPLTGDSAFKVVVETHAHYLGPLPTDSVHQDFLAKLGREPPRAVLIAPVRIRNRTVALLYGENGPNPVAPRLAADLMLFVTHVQLALEAVVRRRKNSSLPGATPPPGAPSRIQSLPAPTPIPVSTIPPRSVARIQTVSLRPPPPSEPPVISTPPTPSIEPPASVEQAPAPLPESPPLRLEQIPALLLEPSPAIEPSEAVGSPTIEMPMSPEGQDPTLADGPPLPEDEAEGDAPEIGRGAEPIPATLVDEIPEPEPLPTPLLASAPPAPSEELVEPPLPTPEAVRGDEDDAEDDWEPVDVAPTADPTTPMSAQDLSAALAGPSASAPNSPVAESEEPRTAMFKLGGSVFEPGAFERAVLADDDGSSLLDELDELAALTRAPTPAPEDALGLDQSPLLPVVRRPMLAVVAEDDPPMLPTPAPETAPSKPTLAVVDETGGPLARDEWETGPLPRMEASPDRVELMRRSLNEDSTVPDLSAEAWIRASSEVTKPRPVPDEIRDRASLPSPPDDPVPLTRLSSTARMSALSPLQPFPADEPVPLIHRSPSTILRAEAPVIQAETYEAEEHHLSALDDTGKIVRVGNIGVDSADEALERQIEQLVDPDLARRQAAAAALGQLQPEILGRVLRVFPGVLTIDPFGANTPLPPFGEASVLLGLLERFGRDAHPHVQKRLDVADPPQRFFATYFYSAVFVPEAIPKLIQRLHDEEPRICMLAARTLFSYREHPDFSVVLDHLHGRLIATSAAARRHAAYLIGLFRDVTAIPKLIDVFDKKDRAMTDVAEDALAEITKQRLGPNVKKWKAWWQKNQSRSRIAWLIEGLSAREAELRRSSAEELRAVTGLDLGYDDDAPRRQREDARQRWVAWWQEQESQRTPSARV